MARKVRPHLGGSETQIASLAPRSLTKQEFGRRVYNLMLGKGWTQAELARRAGLERNHISTYVTGRSFPTPANLEKLANALGVSTTALLPNIAEAAIEADIPELDIKVSPGAPDKAWLRINRLVTLSTAVKIAELLENDDAADRT